MDNNLRLGIMGGTFDPIHIGHLVTAEEAKYQFSLDKILFVPSAHPPHKREDAYSLATDRCNMIELSIEGNPNFSVSRIEMEREGPSYTIETLREIHRMYGKDTELFFITGADAILEIMTWKNPTELFSESRFIAATRPGYSLTKLEAALPKFNSKGRLAMNFVHMMEIPALAISSTQIRARVREGKPFRYLVIDAVWRYIREKGLYLEEG
ncbi:MAG: nicotinate-nucleotide adenylyltransferase [Actinomycetota bacterium]|nr:nicotinate-nucleotide adenylyltransferase [Actinomycetota bacterium]